MAGFLPYFFQSGEVGEALQVLSWVCMDAQLIFHFKISWPVTGKNPRGPVGCLATYVSSRYDLIIRRVVGGSSSSISYGEPGRLLSDTL